jgi:hypothetical protein
LAEISAECKVQSAEKKPEHRFGRISSLGFCLLAPAS